MGWLGFSFVDDPDSTDNIDWLGANNMSWLGASFMGSLHGANNIGWLGV